MVTVEGNLLTLAGELHSPYGVFGPEVLRERSYEHIDPERIRDTAYSVLLENVTPDCTFASTDRGAEGMYHARFGRDTVFTNSLILEGCIASARRFGQISEVDRRILMDSTSSLLALGRYQAVEDNPDNGVKRGQLSHEVRTKGYDHLINPPEGKPWYHNGEELRNYDSVDVTPAWAFMVGRLINLGIIEPSAEELDSLKASLEWTFDNMRQNGGFVGFAYDKNRKYGGLKKHNWMDSEYTMRHQDGSPEVYPLRPVEVQGMAWGAFKQAEPIFRKMDPEYAAKLNLAASALKDRFNGPQGFAFKDRSGKPFLSEAIDGNGRRVENVTCNPGFLLWSSYADETIMDPQMQESVVRKLTTPSMFDPRVGIRTYSKEDTKVFFDPYEYHIGPDTFWPFYNGLIAVGMDELGYPSEAREVSFATLSGVQEFGSAIEQMIRRSNGRLDRYRDPNTGQVSCTDQTWTAAQMFYAYNRFLRQEV